jgi:hypothetical protein
LVREGSERGERKGVGGEREREREDEERRGGREEERGRK